MSLHLEYLEPPQQEREAYLRNALHDLDVLKSQIIDSLPGVADGHVRNTLLGSIADVRYSLVRATG